MGFRNRTISVAELETHGVDVKICEHCKQPLRLRKDQLKDIPSHYLFINRNKGIFIIFHRKCKKPFLAKRRK